MKTKIYTPFTEEQIIQFNKFQQSNKYHPFTCDNSHLENNLLKISRDKIYCDHCDYSQKWFYSQIMDLKI